MPPEKEIVVYWDSVGNLSLPRQSYRTQLMNLTPNDGA